METFIVFFIIVIVLAIFFQGLVKIPVVHKGQLTIWGKRQEKYLNEGWHFLLFYPYYQGLVIINMERISFKIVVERARTPDRANSRIPILVTFRPDPKNFENYINSGGQEGVKTQLEGKIQERVREWCMGREEGPHDWIELNQSQVEASSILLKKIARLYLEEVPNYAQEVPTWIWLIYTKKPRPIKLSYNEDRWAKNKWKRVTDILGKLTPEEIDSLEKAVEKRREKINEVRSGSGKIEIEDLGIVLERLNIGDIDVLGGVAEQAEKQAKEEEERKAEEIELKYILLRIKELQNAGFSKEQALEAVQTERGKVSKIIQEKKFSLSDETKGMIENIFNPKK
jgi:regulator of protease activity HflC (stomatin/prohibitin superfamily)